MEESGERKGFWGSTLSKLKTALSKTKTQIVGSIEDETGDGETLVYMQSPDLLENAKPVDGVIGNGGLVATPPDYASGGAQYFAVSDAATSVADKDATNLIRSTEPGATSSITAEAPRAESAVKNSAQTLAPAPSHAGNRHAIDDEYLEDLEDKLIKSDIGLANVQSMIAHLRKEGRGKSWTSREVIEFLKGEFQAVLKAAPSPELKCVPGKVNIILVVGVNGTGKTTSIGKLCWRFKQEGKRVLMAAGDTFRAAAESQLEIWSERAGVDILRLQEGADPGAVVFTAIDRAKKENYDCLVIDTAGRLHNKTNLMAELGKIRGVVEKHGQGLPLECLLVLDASTGQNGLQQAKVFTEVCKLTGVILTKLDGTAKGGVVFSIAKELQIPVKLIGLGEQMDDLRDFEPQLFVEALF
ncbi:MAG: signal recognition particle-docking protein FtsY [Candidatus Obscuribacterales bacterium]|nr:signal recognition particle-docking protein FtsY [Candidatus Obscuribacterales bacterium]